MKNKSILFLIVGFLLGSIPLLAVSFAEDEQLIPGWIKNTAKFWVEGGVSDKEFLNALQFLVKEGTLKIPEPGTPTLEEALDEQREKIEETEKLPFEINIMSCGLDRYGYFNFEWSIKNNVDKNYMLDLSLIQYDDQGNALRATAHYSDTNAGKTTYDDRGAEAASGATQCGINIEEIIER